MRLFVENFFLARTNNNMDARARVLLDTAKALDAVILAECQDLAAKEDRAVLTERETFEMQQLVDRVKAEGWSAAVGETLAAVNGENAARRASALGLRQATERRRIALRECDTRLETIVAKIAGIRDTIAKALAPIETGGEPGPPGMTAGFGTGARFPLEVMSSDVPPQSDKPAVAVHPDSPVSETDVNLTDDSMQIDPVFLETLRKLGVAA